MTDCFEMVLEVVEKETKRLSPQMVLDDEALDILRDYCEVIDELSENFDGEAFEVKVNSDNTISICFECDDIVVHTTDEKYIQLIERAVTVGFSKSDDETLLVTLTFPSLWKSKKESEV